MTAVLSTRLGRTKPMVFSTVLLAACYVALLNAASPAIYATAQVTAIFAFGMTVPYLFGMCGELDEKGRFMAAGAGMQMAGFGLAPWLSGTIISTSGLAALSVVIGVFVTLALVLAMLSENGLRRP